MSSLPALSSVLARYVATRDARLNKVYPFDTRKITDILEELCLHGSVRVGGRASCGGRPDPTWITYVSWKEVVSKLNHCGWQIKEEPLKQSGAWATVCGGFWEESHYTLMQLVVDNCVTVWESTPTPTH